MNLTERQVEILELYGEGLTEPQIASHLWLSPETVKWHAKQARRTLGARNTTHAVAIITRAKRDKASPHGDPKVPAPTLTPVTGRAPLPHLLAFRVVEWARKRGVVL